MQPVTIADYSETPQYAIKAVSIKTGIRPVTLRAWERRYELLSPLRSENRYRLYSDRDVAILRWIRARLEEGKSISGAVNEFKALLQKGIWPEAVPDPGPALAHPSANPPAYYSGLLMKTLIGHDEAAAGDVLREAHALFDLTTICLEVIIPCLVEIGEAWHRGEIRITDEALCQCLSAWENAHLASGIQQPAWGSADYYRLCAIRAA